MCRVVEFIVAYSWVYYQ